jgi:hypothetical protein
MVRMTLATMNDQILIRIDVPGNVDSMALGDIARVVTLILEITIATLVILARVAIIAWYIGRGILDVWLRIGTAIFVNPLILVVDRMLGYGRYWQG